MWVLMVVAILGVTTCCSGFLKAPGTFSTGPVMVPALAVAARHDAYLGESTLSPAERLEAREESAQLTLGLQAEPEVAIKWFAGAFEPVAGRHDAWVTADEGLLPYQRRTFLRSTEILHGFYEAPE